MFHEKKTVNFQLPFCKTNEEKIKFIVNKLEFTKNKVTFIYHRKTRKLKFRNKIQNNTRQIQFTTELVLAMNPIQEKQNAEIRRNEHCPNNDKKNEVAKYLLENPSHTND